MELGGFLTKEYLNKQEWWNYILNTYLWYIKEKKKLSISLEERTLYS